MRSFNKLRRRLKWASLSAFRCRLFMKQVTVCALYKFVLLENFQEMRAEALSVLKGNEVRGTLLLAKEGINGTLAGSQEGIEAVLCYLKSDVRLSDLSYKLSYNHKNPFYRSKVKLKTEIVTMGVEGVDPNQVVGTYVKPKNWNELISDPETLLVDTRNDYEIEIGTFKNAVNPNTKSFREFPEFIENNLNPKKHKKIAMFCTGGIRCEKSTAYLKEKGFEQVYHLEGGILKYLEETPVEKSMWQGDCFVFDGRVAVNHDLQSGKYDQCFACRYPLTEEEKLSPHYIQGVSCHRCHEETTVQQRNRFNERERQIQLAKTRGEKHIGGEVQATMEQRRQQKLLRRQ